MQSNQKPKKLTPESKKILWVGGITGSVVAAAVAVAVILIVFLNKTSKSSTSSSSTNVAQLPVTFAQFTDGGAYSIMCTTNNGYASICGSCATSVSANSSISIECDTAFTGDFTQQFIFQLQPNGSYLIEVAGAGYVFVCEDCLSQSVSHPTSYDICVSTNVQPNSMAQWVFLPVAGETNQYNIQNLGTSIYLTVCEGCYTNANQYMMYGALLNTIPTAWATFEINEIKTT
jgi:hypothetical protein